MEDETSQESVVSASASIESQTVSTSEPVDHAVVAVVQLSCHPCLTVGAETLLGEPFISEAGRPCLAALASEGLDVNDVRKSCTERYLIWHCARVYAVLEWLGQLPEPCLPDVVVFPEGSIPLAFLKCLKKLVEDKGITIFAGSHSFETTLEAKEHYRGLGLSDTTIAELTRKYGHSCPSVMPVLHRTAEQPFNPDTIVTFHDKTRFSPFERSGTGVETASSAGPDYLVIPLRSGRRIRVLPFLCSEALQYTYHASADAPDLVVIASYDSHPENFDHIGHQFAKNRIPAVYCNDGRFGNSSVFAVRDSRGEDWWSRSPRDGRLPPGDGVLIMRVPIGRTVPGVGIYNPDPCHSILKLSSVVSENDGLPEFQVGREMLDIFAYIVTSTNTNAPIEPQRIVRKLEDLLDFGGPTQIQRVQLQRLLALAHVSSFAIALWDPFASDCIIRRSHTKRARSVFPDASQDIPRNETDAARGTRTSPLNLHQLERNMAVECCERVRFLLHTLRQNHNPSSMLALAGAQDTLCRFLGVTFSQSIPETLSKLLSEHRDRARETITKQLTHALSAFVERFGATSGMLFMVQNREGSIESSRHPDRRNSPPRLISVALSNVPVPQIERQVSSSHEGIVGHVAATGSPYLNEFVTNAQHRPDKRLDPHYQSSISSTRAELAVPIMAPRFEAGSGPTEPSNRADAQEVIGVLNLESRIGGSFSLVDVPRIQSAAAEWAMHLRILQRLLDSSKILGWHPDHSGWRLEGLLNDICFHVGRCMGTSESTPSVSCTVWHADWEKQRIYVRGTSRFDYEYISDYSLPLESFVGRVVTEGAKSRKVTRGFVDDLPDFRRRMKAERMEVHRVIATPIYLPHTAAGSRPIGALTIYSFRHDAAPQVAVDDTFTDAMMIRVADIVGRIVSEFHEMRLEAASAHFIGHLLAHSIPRVDELDQIRALVQRYLDGEWSSLFLLHERSLACVSTSGLLCPLAEATYEIPVSSESPIVGITPFVAQHPGRVVRKLDISDPEENCHAGHSADSDSTSVRLIPQNRVREVGSPGLSSHCRLLSGAFGKGSHTDGVIRLMRSESSPPFVKADVTLLRHLCRLIGSAIEPSQMSDALRTSSRERDTEPLLMKTLVKGFRSVTPPIHFGFSTTDPQKAADRLAAANSRLIVSQQIIQSWLQDWVALFYRDVSTQPLMIPIFGYLRYTSTDEDMNSFLLPLATASPRFRWPTSDNPAFPKSRRNLGWKTIDRPITEGIRPSEPIAIHFDANTPLYRCSTEGSVPARSGICVPLAWAGHGRFIEGVISVDFENEVISQEVIMRAAFMASLRFLLLGSSLKPRCSLGSGLADDEASLHTFVTRHFAWGQICICAPYATPDAQSQPLFQWGEPPQNTGALRSELAGKALRGDHWDLTQRWLVHAVRSGTSWNGGITRVPLRVGAFPAFEFIGELNATALLDVQTDAKRRDAAGGAPCGSGYSFENPAQDHLRLRQWEIAAGLMERWTFWLSQPNTLFAKYDLRMSEVPAKPFDREEEGLRLWHPMFSARPS